jgi:hypothetical protein
MVYWSLVVRAINRAVHMLLRVGIRYLNPLMLSLAGSSRLPMLAVLYHRGRRSGRAFTTQVGASDTRWFRDPSHLWRAGGLVP